MEIQAVALSPSVTVFIRAANKWTLSHNDAYVDQVSLTTTQDGGGGESDEYVTWRSLAILLRAVADTVEDMS